MSYFGYKMIFQSQLLSIQIFYLYDFFSFILIVLQQQQKMNIKNKVRG